MHVTTPDVLSHDHPAVLPRRAVHAPASAVVGGTVTTRFALQPLLQKLSPTLLVKPVNTNDYIDKQPERQKFMPIVFIRGIDIVM